MNFYKMRKKEIMYHDISYVKEQITRSLLSLMKEKIQQLMFYLGFQVICFASIFWYGININMIDL